MKSNQQHDNGTHFCIREIIGQAKFLKKNAIKSTTTKAIPRATALIFLFGLAGSIAAPSAYADPADDYVHATMAKLKIPGMAVAVMRDGKVIKERSYGVASAELGTPTTLDTVYVLASMTKLFTASSIMLLVQEGRISLDDSVTKVLPQLPAKWSNVTIRQCLSHISGLPDSISDDINVTMIAGDRDELFTKLAQQDAKPAGVESSYNQTGYVILGMIIEKISGMPYEQFVQQRIFTPAHLTHASYGDTWKIVPGRSSMYTSLDITPDHTKLLVKDGRPVSSGKQILHYGSKSMSDFMAPAGLANGSLHDLVNWEKTMYEGKLLTAASLQEMATPVKLNDGKDGAFGLSFLIMPVGPYKTVSYGGGAATWRLSVPEKHLTILVLTNLQGCHPEQLALDLAGLYEPDIAKHAND